MTMLWTAWGWVVWSVLRLACRLGQHNWSCRGRRDHVRPDGTVIT
jgi:hypothetical protein